MRLTPFAPCLLLLLAACDDGTTRASQPATPSTPSVPTSAKAAAKAQELIAGLQGEYFSFADECNELEDFPNIANKTPKTIKIDGEINFEATEDDFNGTTLIDQFMVRWTGVIRIPADGSYTFGLESDDGARLFIDQTQVIDHGGLHPMELKTGDVSLSAGIHQIRVEFFESGGAAGCKLLWAKAGGDLEIVPSSALFHVKP